MTAHEAPKAWPPRIVALRSSIREPHDAVSAIVLDPDGHLHPTEGVVYISTQEAEAMVREARAKAFLDAADRARKYWGDDVANYFVDQAAKVRKEKS